MARNAHGRARTPAAATDLRKLITPNSSAPPPSWQPRCPCWPCWFSNLAEVLRDLEEGRHDDASVKLQAVIAWRLRKPRKLAVLARGERLPCQRADVGR
jgi:hypothetical protein